MTALEKKLWADDIDFITKLTKENKELQAKIDKAIEYINKDMVVDNEYHLSKLLDILKS